MCYHRARNNYCFLWCLLEGWVLPVRGYTYVYVEELGMHFSIVNGQVECVKEKGQSSEAQIANIWLAPHLGIQMECMTFAHNLPFFLDLSLTGPYPEASKGHSWPCPSSHPILTWSSWLYLPITHGHFLPSYSATPIWSPLIIWFPRGLLPPYHCLPSMLLTEARWVFKNVNLYVMIWLMSVCFQLDCGTDLVCFADRS